VDERLVPCECCGHPLSQCHHLASFADFGDTLMTMQLCANCHELVHLIYSGVYVGQKTALYLAEKAGAAMGGRGDPRIRFLSNVAKEMNDLEGEMWTARRKREEASA
jgi:hypothetical protein